MYNRLPPNLPLSPFTSEYTTPDRVRSVTDLFMGDISVSKQFSFLAGDLLEPLDPQTAQFSLVMDVDSSCFNETDRLPFLSCRDRKGTQRKSFNF